MFSPIRAYSCRPAGAEWHLVVFAASARRARLLAFRARPSNDDEYTEWRARRLSRADGLYASEKVWVHHRDAPDWLQAVAASLWREVY